jgi:hypothetical protein
MPVAYSELAGSPKESGDRESFQATRRLLCAWADRFTLMSELLVPFPGQIYPHAPGLGAHAKSCSAEPHGKEYGIGTLPYYMTTYSQAIVTCNYQTPRADDPEIQGDTIVSESYEPSVEFVTLDPTNFRWGSPTGEALNPDEAPGRLVHTADYVYTRYLMPAVPAGIASLIGKVNDSTLAATIITGLTFAPGTLLFRPPSISRITTTTGAKAFTIAYRMTHRPEGWNQFWRNATQTYASIYVADGAQYKNHPEADFLAAFA